MKRLGFLVILVLVFCMGIISPSTVFAERSVSSAVSWAEDQVDSTNWVDQCFVFVRSAYGEGSVPGRGYQIDSHINRR